LSASSFRHLLVVIGDEQDEMWALLDRAVELADAEHARLTLAKTCGPGRVAMCLCSFAALACAPPVRAEQLQLEASRRLAQAAEFVPAAIPLCTLVLGTDTPRSLRRLVQTGSYDLIVASQCELRRDHGLRRAIRKLGIAALMVTTEPVAQSRLLARKAFRPRPAPQI
jgi:hypothetical protein